MQVARNHYLNLLYINKLHAVKGCMQAHISIVPFLVAAEAAEGRAAGRRTAEANCLIPMPTSLYTPGVSMIVTATPLKPAACAPSERPRGWFFGRTPRGAESAGGDAAVGFEMLLRFRSVVCSKKIERSNERC